MKAKKEVPEKENINLNNAETIAGDINQDEVGEGSADTQKLKADAAKFEKQANDYFSALQRAAAEFDNYKKRTQREKEALYSDSVADVVAAFLPILDNLGRALAASEADAQADTMRSGLELVMRQFKDILKSLGVEEIKCVNEQFNPKYHNAVMHTEDDSIGSNKVVEELQKGYVYKERVIRHSMCKVVN